VQAFYRMWCLHEARFKLGSTSVADYVFEQPGLHISMSCVRPLIVAPELVVVELDSLTRGA
jgi:hypothetical protein